MSASVIELPVTRQHRWTWPHWPADLYEDSHGRFHYEGGVISRQAFGECVRAVGDDAPALLSDLVEDGTIGLDWPGSVASVWATTRHAPSALTTARWVALFRANGFTIDGEPASPPADPVRLFRGTVPVIRFFEAEMRLVPIDDRGGPVDPSAVVEIRDTVRDLAWTNNMRAARQAARWCLPGRAGAVFTTLVEPEHLLARIGTDFVVDPAGLRTVDHVDTAGNLTRWTDSAAGR